MGKVYIEKNVLEASFERLKYIFQHFDNILVAFSGGKDSGVMLNLTIDYAKSIKALNRVAVYHLDYEAQYQMTTDYVTETFKNLPPEVKKFWLCLPVHAQCSVSMFQDHWIPWQQSKKDIWVREMPDYKYVINEMNAAFFYDTSDYEAQDNFCKWFADNYEYACVLVGIRASESLYRHAAIASRKKVNQYNYKNYLTYKDNYVIGYPIYDFEVHDVWVANAKFNYKYNHLYDLYYHAGLSIYEMRVASPFNNCGQESLKLYRVIDPNNWGKFIGRVNGVNFAGIYGGSYAMGWKSIKLPPEYTWKSYMEFLLDTLPLEIRSNYLKKLNTSIKFWKEKGGVLKKETIKKLVDNGIAFELTENNYSNRPSVKMDYLDDLECDEFRFVPTYKRMCVCIMKNDHACKYMGFNQTKEEIRRRKEVMDKWKSLF